MYKKLSPLINHTLKNIKSISDLSKDLCITNYYIINIIN